MTQNTRLQRHQSVDYVPIVWKEISRLLVLAVIRYSLRSIYMSMNRVRRRGRTANMQSIFGPSTLVACCMTIMTDRYPVCTWLVPHTVGPVSHPDCQSLKLMGFWWYPNTDFSITLSLRQPSPHTVLRGALTKDQKAKQDRTITKPNPIKIIQAVGELSRMEITEIWL